MSGLTSLISHIGDDKLTFQWLIPSITKIDLKKNETSVTFVAEHENITPAMIMNGNPKRVGMVIWMDMDDLNSWKETQE